jgi:hypothetical protein
MSVSATISKADNQILLFLNGLLIYSKYTDFDPTFSDTVDFTAQLRGSNDWLTMVGLNWGGPANFAVSLDVNSNVTNYGTNGSIPSPVGVAWFDAVQID